MGGGGEVEQKWEIPLFEKVRVFYEFHFCLFTSDIGGKIVLRKGLETLFIFVQQGGVWALSKLSWSVRGGEAHKRTFSEEKKIIFVDKKMVCSFVMQKKKC